MNNLWLIYNIAKDRLTNEARQYERELADVRRQKERVEEKMMAQYKSPSPPKKSKGILDSNIIRDHLLILIELSKALSINSKNLLARRSNEKEERQIT